MKILATAPWKQQNKKLLHMELFTATNENKSRFLQN